jgi:hypothetical protein
MLRQVMHTSLFCDVHSPQWREELQAMRKLSVDGVSSVVTVNRPGFSPSCEFPFDCVQGVQGRDAGFCTAGGGV